MRAIRFAVVLAIHAMIFLLFTWTVSPRRDQEIDAPATTLALLTEPVAKPVESAPAGRVVPGAARRAAPRPPAPVSSAPEPQPEPQPEPSSITPTPAPDWHAEVGIAAANVLEAQRHEREHPSVLEPHDFSRVTPGSTDTSKPRFGWSHARTHRVEGAPGALVINVNDRCAITVLLIFPFPVCKIGKIAAQGNLFEHMYDPPVPKPLDLPRAR